MENSQKIDASNRMQATTLLVRGRKRRASCIMKGDVCALIWSYVNKGKQMRAWQKGSSLSSLVLLVSWMGLCGVVCIVIIISEGTSLPASLNF